MKKLDLTKFKKAGNLCWEGVSYILQPEDVGIYDLRNYCSVKLDNYFSMKDRIVAHHYETNFYKK